jgi:hypothetical protein
MWTACSRDQSAGAKTAAGAGREHWQSRALPPAPSVRSGRYRPCVGGAKTGSRGDLYAYMCAKIPVDQPRAQIKRKGNSGGDLHRAAPGPCLLRAVAGVQRASSAAALPSGERSHSTGVYRQDNARQRQWGEGQLRQLNLLQRTGRGRAHPRPGACRCPSPATRANLGFCRTKKKGGGACLRNSKKKLSLGVTMSMDSI